MQYCQITANRLHKIYQRVSLLSYTATAHLVIVLTGGPGNSYLQQEEVAIALGRPYIHPVRAAGHRPLYTYTL